VLITKIPTDYKDFKINEIFESKRMEDIVGQLKLHAKSISESQIHPYFAFNGYKDYPNPIKTAMSLRVVEMAISQSEEFLDRVFRNSIRVVDKKENEPIFSFFTESIDDSLAEVRESGALKKFIKAHGAHFRFIDKFGEQILQDVEAKFSLQNILQLVP
jgi:hypothetical protein